MFHHVSLFKLKPGITLERVRTARQELAGLVERLPGVLYFTVTDNLSDLNGGYTIALFSAFENREAFDVCQGHPEYHRVWKNLLHTIVDDRIVAEGEAG